MEPIDVVMYGKKRSEEGSRDWCDVEYSSREIHFKRPLTEVDFKNVSPMVCHDSEQGPFALVPNEILVLIFSFIDNDKTFSRLIQINKKWNHLGDCAWYSFTSMRNLLNEEDFWKQKGKDWKWVLQTKVRSFSAEMFSSGQACGVGFYNYSDKQRYEGDFVCSKRQGMGKETWNDAIYKGQWADDMKEGFGQLAIPNGASYIGSWAKNRKNGPGCYTFPNGDQYDGEWKDDMKHGKGAYTFGKGRWEGDKYDGEWKDNKKCGKGVYVWKDGDVYNGEFEEDNFNGFGTYFFSCGDRYIGEWKADKRYGQGVYTYNHGGKFDGTFKEGKRNGAGVFTWKDGDSFKGFWSLGSRKGLGVFMSKDGVTVNQFWNEAPDANYSVHEPPKHPIL
jgi:hypothetical protein